MTILVELGYPNQIRVTPQKLGGGCQKFRLIEMNIWYMVMGIQLQVYGQAQQTSKSAPVPEPGAPTLAFYDSGQNWPD